MNSRIFCGALTLPSFGAVFDAFRKCQPSSVSFPLVKITEDAVYFSGFTLRRIDENTLQGYLVASGESGIREVELSYRRVASSR